MNTKMTAAFASALTVALLATACGTEAEPTAAPAADEVASTSEAAPTEQEVEPISLSVASFVGPDTPQAKTLQWWADEITARSPVPIDFEIFWAGALLAGPDLIPGVADGRADVGYTLSAFAPSQLPLTTMSELPFVTADASAVPAAMTALHEDSTTYQNEWEAAGLKLMYMPAVGPAVFGTTFEPSSREAFEGRSIRGLGLMTEVMGAAGVNGVSIATGETYEAVARGVVDGYVWVFESIGGFKLNEVVDHVTNGPFGTYSTAPVFMNLDVYDSLPAEVRDIISDVSAEALEQSVAFLAEVEQETCTLLTDSDVTVTFQPEDAWVQQWQDGVDVDSFTSAWLDRMTEAGVADAADILDDYLEQVADHEAVSTYTSPIARCAE